MCFHGCRIQWSHRMLLPQKKKKSLLSRNQEKPWNGKEVTWGCALWEAGITRGGYISSHPDHPHPPAPSSLLRHVWFGYVSVYICGVSGTCLFTYVPHFIVCVLETNRWSEDWKWCFKWKAEIRRTKKSIKRESRFSKSCASPSLLNSSAPVSFRVN